MHNTVFITGGNRGIGLELCKKFAFDYNFKVYMGSRDLNKAKEAINSLGSPNNIIPIEIDVEFEDSISNAYKEYLKLKDKDEKLYIFINNAAAQLDWIPGTPGISATVEQKIEGAEKTWENFLYMRKHVNSPDKLVYVFHVGENFDFLKNALNYVDEKGPIKALALGGLVDKPMTVKKEFISRCFQIIEKSSHKPSVHGFGLNTFSLLYKYPFTSADATSWVRTAGLGSIMGPNGYIGISDRRSVLPNHYDNLEPEQVQEFLKFIESYGANVDDLKKDPNARAYFNACFIKRWCDNYKRQHEVSYLSSLF